jgi:hypothetical protein
MGAKTRLLHTIKVNRMLRKLSESKTVNKVKTKSNEETR